MTTPAAYALSVPDIAARAAGYQIPGVVVDGQDPIAVDEAASRAVLRARKGEGPSLVEAKTYRYLEHAAQLPVVPYRTSQEIEEWKRERDPLHNFRRRLVTEGVLGEADAAAIGGYGESRDRRGSHLCQAEPVPGAR